MNSGLNFASLSVPNVYVNVIPPNPLLNGVPTDIVGVVGTAMWGPVNSPMTVGSLQELIYNFGAPQAVKYDLGTPVYAAIQQGASNFLCVRVTDGTDVKATSDILDNQGSPEVGAILTAIYSGTVGNSLQANMSKGSNSTTANPTFKLAISFTNGIPEVFDNIGGSGATFWANLVSAVNNGQGNLRGPSQLVTANFAGAINSVAVTSAGSYATLPTFGATVGNGATFVGHMKAVSATLGSGGTGYTAGDILTVSGGTSSTTAKITVDTVNGSGVVLTFHISTAGDYTALPSSPVSVTGGSGSGATFNLLWGLLSVTVSASGTGYTSSSLFTITGGGGTGGSAGTLSIGTTSPPSLADNPYSFSGGANGNAGITDVDLIGDDASSPRTGMYALRNTNASIAVIADQTDPTYWDDQVEFGEDEQIYMIGTVDRDYQDNISGAVTLRENAGILSAFFSLMQGDWEQINDPFNNVTRFISPQGFKAGILAAILPSGSSLNKQIVGLIATQKTAENRIYSDADLSQLKAGGLDVITRPIPLSASAFGCRLGINTSGQDITNGDNYPRMVGFLSKTLATALGQFIGLQQTVDVRRQAKNTIQSFLSNLQQLGMIGTADGSPAFSVTLDDSNNPPNRVALGYMQADVQVPLLHIIQYLVVNLQAGQSVQVQVLPPQVR